MCVCMCVCVVQSIHTFIICRLFFGCQIVNTPLPSPARQPIYPLKHTLRCYGNCCPILQTHICEYTNRRSHMKAVHCGAKSCLRMSMSFHTLKTTLSLAYSQPESLQEPEPHRAAFHLRPFSCGSTQPQEIFPPPKNALFIHHVLGCIHTQLQPSITRCQMYSFGLFWVREMSKIKTKNKIKKATTFVALSKILMCPRAEKSTQRGSAKN